MGKYDDIENDDFSDACYEFDPSFDDWYPDEVYYDEPDECWCGNILNCLECFSCNDHCTCGIVE